MTEYLPQGSQGLVLKEDTIFERSAKGRKGFDLPNLDVPVTQPTSHSRHAPAELPEVSELDVVRHFTRLSSWNYSIDTGLFPLGSCTMKYNPRINEEIAALPGFALIHPDMPPQLTQGAFELLYTLENCLSEIVGMDAISLQPAAGANGEFTGLSLIRAFHEAHGSSRKYVVIPESAHGTNPASCTLTGYQSIPIPTNEKGIVEAKAVHEVVSRHGREIAAMMLTIPNTLGIFESNILEISDVIHEVGAQMYMDGANMNALMGVARPGDMGIDVMQYNLHKTFSTPHGGGGPGAGPVAVKKHLAEFLPNPRVVRTDHGFSVENLPKSIGKVKGSLGNFGVLVRALCYILHHGSDGLKKVTQNAVLNANYIRARLREHYDLSLNTPTLHECVFTDKRQQGVTKTLNIAKALIDRGFHPPTIYFPLVVSGALLIEPTETESLQDIERFVNALIEIADLTKNRKETFENAPQKTIVGRVDEVMAARRPVLTLDDRAR